MLKRFWIKKIMIASSALFALLLICLIPKEDKTLTNIKQELEYVDKGINKNEIFLLDVNNYLARTSVALTSTDVTGKAKEILNTLITGSSGESKIPNGFRGVLPADTKILTVEYEDKILKINLSNEVMDVKEDMEEKVIEAIVYNLTSIDGVDKIMLFVDGNILTKLPKTGINLPTTLDRSYGINKEYDINSTKNITNVTVYYVNKYNGNEYYVPVTKYVNDDREKIQIIVDELTSSPIYSSNLMSYLNYNAKLLDYSFDEDEVDLNFNEYLFDNKEQSKVLEEVIYSISYSVMDSYGVSKINFFVNNKQI